MCDLLSDRRHEFVFQFELLLKTSNHSVEANAVLRSSLGVSAWMSLNVNNAYSCLNSVQY